MNFNKTTLVRTDLYPHMPTYVHTPRDTPRTVHLYRDVYGGSSHPKLYFPVAGRFVWFWVLPGGAKFAKMGDSLPRMPINQGAKFDAASFILGGEIRNRTNKQKNEQINKQTSKQANSERYIHTLPIGMCG